MTKSDIEIIEDGGATIAVLGTEYDNLNDDNLMAASETLLSLASRVEPPKLILDLSQTRFFASAFLGALFRVWNRLSHRGGSMAMCCPSEVCADVLRVTNVAKLWGIYQTRQEAIDALTK